MFYLPATFKDSRLHVSGAHFQHFLTVPKEGGAEMTYLARYKGEAGEATAAAWGRTHGHPAAVRKIHLHVVDNRVSWALGFGAGHAPESGEITLDAGLPDAVRNQRAREDGLPEVVFAVLDRALAASAKFTDWTPHIDLEPIEEQEPIDWGEEIEYSIHRTCCDEC